MAVNGVASIWYGAEDLDEGIRFYRDFGLELVTKAASGADFVLPDGASVHIRRADDPSLPAPYESAIGVRRVVWGVDSAAEFARLQRVISTDREIAQGDDGVSCFLDDVGLPIGLRLFPRRELKHEVDSVNSPGFPNRKNSPRKWYEQAKPQSIQHVVFFTPDVRRAMRFYCERLEFRISDISRGRGILARSPERHDHHNIFFAEGDALRFQHIAFDLQNVDELMAGAAYMQRHGWRSDVGLGRHRLSSSIFYYIPNPCGGESEYSVDTDWVDNDWKPGIWDPAFGRIHWLGERSAFPEQTPQGEVHLLDRPATVDDYYGA